MSTELLDELITALASARNAPPCARVCALRVMVERSVLGPPLREAVWAATRERVPVTVDGAQAGVRRRTHAEVAAATGLREGTVAAYVTNHRRALGAPPAGHSSG